ncbi:probable G-protein coupled receptor 139 [Narcine bancroftii]|uniref:probable G-protein coupled receptor 139 n=1 Tax=Narcine bancroftii TaxID=1343680 RepID=UPI003831686F
MAVADLMTVVLEVLLYHLVRGYGLAWEPNESILFNMAILLNKVPFCCVHYALCHVAVDCSVWFTVAFTFDRFVVICWRKIKEKYCTPKYAFIIIGTISTAFCLKNIPFYFMHLDLTEGDEMCGRRHVLPFSKSFEGFYWVDRLLNPLLPFFLILTLNALTVRQILAASRVRRKLRGQRDAEKQRDPEMESRRQSIILLFTLSASFLLCWATTTMVFILMRCLRTDLETSIRLYFANMAGTVIQLFSCCTNTFIYGVTQRKFREQMIAPIQILVEKIRQRDTRG